MRRKESIMQVQVFIDNGSGIHLAVLEDEKPVFVHRFDNVNGVPNGRTDLGECIVELMVNGYDDDWEGNDLEEFPTIYDELYDEYDPIAEFDC